MFCERQTKVHYTCPRYTATVILFWESLAISLFSYLCMRMCCLSVCLTDNGWQTMAETVSFLSMFIILLSYPFSLLILPSITSWLICFRLLRQNTAKLRLCGWGKQHFNNWDNNVFFHPNVSVYIAQPVLPHIPAPFDIVTLMDVAVVKLTMKLVYHLNPWLSVYDINTSSKDAELYSRRPHTWVQGVIIKEKLDVYLHAHQQDYWLINKPSSQTSKSVMCLIK